MPMVTFTHVAYPSDPKLRSTAKAQEGVSVVHVYYKQDLSYLDKYPKRPDNMP
jgi:hypothetical protein